MDVVSGKVVLIQDIETNPTMFTCLHDIGYPYVQGVTCLQALNAVGRDAPHTVSFQMKKKK